MNRFATFAILFATLSLACQGLAQNLSSDPAIRQAQIQLYHEMQTREGRAYDKSLGKEFQEKYTAVLRDCKNAAKPADRLPFTMYAQFAASGHVEKVLLDPANTLTTCAQKILLKDAFSPPPRADYWIQITVQVSHPK